MAQLDRLLATIAGDKSGILTLEEGGPARVVQGVGGSVRPVTRGPLTSQQIMSLVREVAPRESIQELDRGSPATFTYTSTEGSFDARAEVTSGRWSVRIGVADVDPLPAAVAIP